MGDGLKGIQSEDRMQEVKRVIVSQKELDGEDRDALGELVECAAMEGDISSAIVKVYRTVLGDAFSSDALTPHRPRSTKASHCTFIRRRQSRLTFE